jgi:hypothetical protein
MAAVPEPVRRLAYGGQLNGADHCPGRSGPACCAGLRLRHRPPRFSEWQEGVVDGHMSESDPGKSAQEADTRTHRPGHRSVTSELTHIEPPRTWGSARHRRPIRATVDLTVEPLTETKSRLTIAVDFEGHGVGKVLVPLFVRRQARKRCRSTSLR